MAGADGGKVFLFHLALADDRGRDGVGAGSQHRPQQVAAHQEAAQPMVGFEPREQRAGAGDLLELVRGGAHQHDGAEEAREHGSGLEAHEHGGEPAVEEDEHGGQGGEAAVHRMTVDRRRRGNTRRIHNAAITLPPRGQWPRPAMPS